jgi:hypothetical protein
MASKLLEGWYTPACQVVPEPPLLLLELLLPPPLPPPPQAASVPINGNSKTLNL